MSPERYTASTITDDQLDALYANARKGWRRGDIWKAKAQEIEADRDRLAAELEQAQARAAQAEDLLQVAHETSNRAEAERTRAVQRANKAEDVIERVREVLAPYGWQHAQVPAARLRTALAQPKESTTP